MLHSTEGSVHGRENAESNLGSRVSTAFRAAHHAHMGLLYLAQGQRAQNVPALACVMVLADTLTNRIRDKPGELTNTPAKAARPWDTNRSESGNNGERPAKRKNHGSSAAASAMGAPTGS